MTRGWQAVRAWAGAWILAMGAAAALAAPQVNKLAPPDWVEPIAPPLAVPESSDKLQPGTVYLLADLQTRVEPGGSRQAWRHYAMLARDTQGVESLANIEVGFDPTYQTLTLHLLRVHRGGQVQDRLKAAQVRVIQRERDLETLIYDGSRTASIFLDDVRVGDVVEYAYSVGGSNPVFGGRHFGSFDLRWTRPLAQLRLRLLWPAGRPLSVHGAPEPFPVEQRTLGAYTEYRLQRDGVAGLRVESGAPPWYDPFDTWYWSEFKSWPDVAAWALPLYRTPTELPAALRAERDRILATHSQPADRAAAALRWVQREIRYLGIEVGVNSHAPTPPAVVVARRFGDCKDKTLVAVTLLRALGLQAEPALVNTEHQRGLPAPGAFDHVIVRLRLGGNTYWLDATRRPQPGDLDSLSQPDWGLALPINAAGEGLVAMDSGPAARSLRKVHLLVDVGAGLAEPTTLTVTSDLWGKTAEAERAAHAEDGSERVQQRYLNFYAADYPGLRVAAPMELHDDPATNRLRVVEHYTMDPIFKRIAEKKRLEVEFMAPEIRSLLNSPRERVRQAPLAVNHAVEVTHELEIRLPESWPLKPKTSVVDNPAFTLHHELRGEQPVGDEFRVIKLIDQYKSRVDHIDAGAVAAYAADLEKARDSLGYDLYKRDSHAPVAGPKSFNLPIALLGLFMLAAWARLARRLHRWDPPPPAGAPADGPPVSGALLLMPLHLLAVFVYVLVDVVGISTAFEPHRWAELTLPSGSQYHPLFSTLLLVELAVMMAWVAAAGLALHLAWERRSSAPRVYLALAWAMPAWALLDACVAGPLLAEADLTGQTHTGIATLLVLGGLACYVALCDRARETFVHRAASPAPTADPAMATPG